MTKNRLKVLRYWLAGKRNNVNFRHLLNFLSAPSYYRKAGKLISSIKELDDYIVVNLKGLAHPLYYPKSMDLQSLKQVLVELFYEENWHYYQIKETKVQPDDIVIDCGGAEGAFSLVASTICKKCYVIEPSPEFKGALNLTFRGIDNVEILQCALSDEVGNGTIKMQGIMSSLSDDDAAGGASVKIETIDNLFYERKIPADYIKADLEGYDLKAIIGAKKTIQKYKPRIAITTYHHSEHAKLIGAYIKEIEPGYDIKVKGIYQETGSPVMLHAWFKQS